MKEFGADVNMDTFDFSKDSRIKESLLSRIKAEYFGELSENQLELVSAAGNPDAANTKLDLTDKHSKK